MNCCSHCVKQNKGAKREIAKGWVGRQKTGVWIVVYSVSERERKEEDVCSCVWSLWCRKDGRNEADRQNWVERTYHRLSSSLRSCKSNCDVEWVSCLTPHFHISSEIRERTLSSAWHSWSWGQLSSTQLFSGGVRFEWTSLSLFPFFPFSRLYIYVICNFIQMPSASSCCSLIIDIIGFVSYCIRTDQIRLQISLLLSFFCVAG